MSQPNGSAQALSLRYLQSGLRHLQQGELESAEQCFASSLALTPNHPEGLHLLGLVWSSKGDAQKAIQLIESSLKIQPQNHIAWNNLGNIFRLQGQLDQSLLCYDRATALKADYFVALANKGAAAQALHQPALAARCYRAAIGDPRAGEANRCTAIQEEMALCDWSNADEIHSHLPRAIEAGVPGLPTFSILAMLDDPQLHLKAAQTEGATHAVPARAHSWPSKSSGEVIKVAYFSADFQDHATSWLMADLFEQHNPTKFEIHAFSFGPNREDAMRKRLRNAFRHFHDIGAMKDEEVARFSRSLGIDIAVDLKGYTKDCRPGIFAHRAAPIQVNYLGYPGSMGVDYIDYLLGDPIVTPAEAHKNYQEKIVQLPYCYQPNDSRRGVPGTPAERAHYDLPDDAFVFCCFNNNYKITPGQFQSWMTLLKRVERSVLWLYVAQPAAIENLRSAAEAAGVDASRLRFAGKTSHDEHLKRYQCADLFLDTFPYNAHTTASDALWMGLPLVTLRGHSFASRVAASLLHACDLGDLVTTSPDAYVDKAVALASHPALLRSYASHLSTNRHRLRLFDTPSLARAIESAYATMAHRHRHGLAPEAFAVAPG